MSIRSLPGHIDKDVLVSLNGIDGLHQVRLRVVEESGVWVENEELVKVLLSALGWETGAQEVVFLPFPQIRFILTGCEAGFVEQKRVGWHGAAVAAPAKGC